MIVVALATIGFVFQRARAARLLAERELAQRRETEGELHESEERFRSMFEAAQFGIALGDLDGRFLRVNPAFSELLGYGEEDLLGTSFLEYTHPDDVERNLALFEEANAKTDRYRFVKRYLRKDGSVVWADLSASVVRDGEGRPLFNFAIVADITERKRLEDRLRQAEKLEAVGRLAGGIAHDFNNLLTVIGGHTGFLLARANGNESERTGLAEIGQAVERAVELTGQLLALSRGRPPVARALDLSKVVGGLEAMLDRLIGEGVELRTRLTSKPVPVWADPGELTQVIVNLAVNARDAMPDGGTLTITTERIPLSEAAAEACGQIEAGPCALLTVSDTGMGMDAETQARIFEPFFTTKEHGKGTGLGLATVYGIVKQRGGHIEVQSSHALGTGVVVYLPLTTQEPEPEPAPVQAPPTELPACDRSGETILLVEDTDEVRKLASLILREHGYTVFDARSASEARLYCEEHDRPIDLLLSDVVMPRESGIELAEALRKLRPGMRVLFMSGYIDPSTGETFPEAAYLQKPFTRAALATRVREALDSPTPYA